ncbi:MAG: hypothetical protein L0216_08080 [Planctomycetales bacterium]|nr:hypothetical protein [Planctomycetales bacterium]
MTPPTLATWPSSSPASRAPGLPGAPGAMRPGLRTAAIVLMALPSELAARVLAGLPRPLVDAVTLAVVRLRDVTRDEQARAVADFAARLRAAAAGGLGGVERARALVQRAFPPEEAARHLERISRESHRNPFEFVVEAGVARVLPFLRDENPQTIALICACVGPAPAAEILLGLPGALQGEVLRRVASLGGVHPDAAAAASASLERRVSTAPPLDVRGGPAAILRIVAAAGPGAEAIRRSLAEADPDLARALAAMGPLRPEEGLAEALLETPPEALARALRDVPVPTLARALRAAPPDLADRISGALPAALRDVLRQEAARLGPVRVGEAEEALDAIRRVLGGAR